MDNGKERNTEPEKKTLQAQPLKEKGTVMHGWAIRDE
jgi:hypothetical protein